MRVAISGAGVAGPAFAHWMRRAGHEVTLIEAASSFRTGGYVIDFWGLGYSIAEKMGIDEDIRKVGYQIQELRAVGSDGRINASLHVEMIRRATNDRYISVARGDLAAAIYRTVENDIETIYSDTITAIENQSDHVSVRFKHAPPRDFDMVIGADGLHSTVRELAFGPERIFAHYLGCQVAACVIEGYRPRDELVYVTHNLANRHIGRFALDDDRTLVLFIFRSSSPYIPGTLDSCKALLRSHFTDAGWESPQILAALDGVDDIYLDLVSQIRMDRGPPGEWRSSAMPQRVSHCSPVKDGSGLGRGVRVGGRTRDGPR